MPLPSLIGSLSRRAAASEILTPTLIDWETALADDDLWVVPGWASRDFTAQSIAAGSVYYIPMLVPEQQRFNEIGVRIQSAGSAGAEMRLAIYTFADGLPADLVIDYGTVPIDSVTNQVIATSVDLDPGIYAIAYVASASAELAGYRADFLQNGISTGRSATISGNTRAVIPRADGFGSVVSGGFPASAPVAQGGLEPPEFIIPKLNAGPRLGSLARQPANVPVVFDFSSFVTGDSWGLPGTASLDETEQSVGDTLRYVFFAVPQRQEFTAVGVRVMTAASAGSLLRIGLYGYSDGAPTTLIEDFGTVSVDSMGEKVIVTTFTLDAGVYALAYVTDGSPGLAGEAFGDIITNISTGIAGSVTGFTPFISIGVQSQSSIVADGFPTQAPADDTGTIFGPTFNTVKLRMGAIS